MLRAMGEISPKKVTEAGRRGLERIYGPQLTMSDEKLAEELRYVQELLRWIAPKIIVRDGNGKRSQRMCILCPRARALRIPCRHAEIFAFLDAQDETKPATA